jgi:hypothetical protein
VYETTDFIFSLNLYSNLRNRVNVVYGELMTKTLQLTKIDFVCKRCDPVNCTFTISVLREHEEKYPTKDIRKICPLFSSRDNYATFERVK